VILLSKHLERLKSPEEFSSHNLEHFGNF